MVDVAPAVPISAVQVSKDAVEKAVEKAGEKAGGSGTTVRSDIVWIVDAAKCEVYVCFEGRWGHT